MDYPVAPKAVGYLYGQAVLGEVVELKDLPEALKEVEEVELKRKFTASCVKAIEVPPHPLWNDLQSHAHL